MYEEQRKIVTSGVKLLNDEYTYENTTIIAKLEVLGCKINPASFSNIITNKRKVGDKLIKKTAETLKELVLREICCNFDERSSAFQLKKKPKDWKPDFVIIEPKVENAGYIFYKEGRLSINQKVKFIESAESEVIEIGARLKTFTDYFKNRSKAQFSDKINLLLKKGVNFKLYTIDPDCAECGIYFSDRSKILKDEANSIRVVQETIPRLKEIINEIKTQNYKGKFQLFKYRHIPYSHFHVVDGDLEQGKIIISNYLFGVSRADCPVIEVNKKNEEKLYEIFYKSYKSFIENAELIASS